MEEGDTLVEKALQISYILKYILFMTLKCQEANKFMSNKAKKKPKDKLTPKK